eukprot:COSAG02_NODE_578_length_20075_cov_93.607930_2_plen_125_part_00
MDHPRVACRWESQLDSVDLSTCFSHVEGCLYARSSRAQRAASAACAAAKSEGRVPQQLLLDAVPDIQIQQDHVRTNDDVSYKPSTRPVKMLDSDMGFVQQIRLPSCQLRAQTQPLLLLIDDACL